MRLETRSGTGAAAWTLTLLAALAGLGGCGPASGRPSTTAVAATPPPAPSPSASERGPAPSPSEPLPDEPPPTAASEASRNTGAGPAQVGPTGDAAEEAPSPPPPQQDWRAEAERRWREEQRRAMGPCPERRERYERLLRRVGRPGAEAFVLTRWKGRWWDLLDADHMVDVNEPSVRLAASETRDEGTHVCLWAQPAKDATPQLRCTTLEAHRLAPGVPRRRLDHGVGEARVAVDILVEGAAGFEWLQARSDGTLWLRPARLPASHPARMAPARGGRRNLLPPNAELTLWRPPRCRRAACRPRPVPVRAPTGPQQQELVDWLSSFKDLAAVLESRRPGRRVQTVRWNRRPGIGNSAVTPAFRLVDVAGDRVLLGEPANGWPLRVREADPLAPGALLLEWESPISDETTEVVLMDEATYREFLVDV